MPATALVHLTENAAESMEKYLTKLVNDSQPCYNILVKLGFQPGAVLPFSMSQWMMPHPAPGHQAMGLLLEHSHTFIGSISNKITLTDADIATNNAEAKAQEDKLLYAHLDEISELKKLESLELATFKDKVSAQQKKLLRSQEEELLRVGQEAEWKVEKTKEQDAPSFQLSQLVTKVNGIIDAKGQVDLSNLDKMAKMVWHKELATLASDPQQSASATTSTPTQPPIEFNTLTHHHGSH